MYLRGHPHDYDGWAQAGNPGWGWSDVLPYFKKSENNQTFSSPGDPHHGQGGPVWVEELRTDNPWHATLRQACQEAGWPYNPDLNGAAHEGFRPTQVMMKGGERHHAGQAYILPHLGTRPNLQLQCDSPVTRVLFEGRRAVGVEVVQGGIKRQIRARRGGHRLQRWPALGQAVAALGRGRWCFVAAHGHSCGGAPACRGAAPARPCGRDPGAPH